ncbi:MAG TPA: hypothetical protein VH857_07790 [Actinomycetes bacterium]|nr:hypothetical protein [Actinomycetes bacterium]
MQNYASQLRGLPEPGDENHVRWGLGLWLSLASLVLAVAATTILVWSRRPPAGEDDRHLDEVGTSGSL